MSMVSIGDLARSLLLQRHTTATKATLDRLAGSLASGRHADPAARMRGDLGPLAAIEGALARIGGWQSAANALSDRIGAMQVALGALNGIGQAQADALVRAGASVQPPQVDLAAADARAHLDSAMGILNARMRDQSVFAGTRGDGPAVVEGEALLDALWPAVAGAATAEEARQAVQAWFADPAGFEAQAYLGGPAQSAIAVGPGQSAAPGVTATAPAIKDLLAGLAMAALMDRGLFDGQPQQRQTLAGMAGVALSTNADARAWLAGGLGITESRLDQAQARNSAEETALELARSGLIAADPYATATELEAARIQLETLYAITARLSGLSLVGALR